MHTREHLRHIGKNLFLRTPGQCGSVLFLRLINRYHPSSFHPAFSVIRFLLITFSCFYAGYLAVLFLRQPRYLTPDQLFIVLLLFVLGIQKGRRIRLFLVDWLPFILLIILYNMMRSLAPRLYSRAHVSEPYQGELTVLGWMANSDIPAFALQSWRADHAGEFLMIAAEVVLGAAYASFFIAPIVLMAILWWKLKDRRLFWRFSCLLNLHNFMALATFVLYPAAPPWYFQRYGAIQPTDTAYGQVAAGGLVHLDEMFNMGLFTTVWGSFNQNYFAALPSLHAAWPVVVAMFTLLAFGRKAWPIIFYPGLVITGGAYFNHHYLIDYLVSWAYLLVAFIVIERAVMPWLDRVMDYNLLRANGILSGGLSSNPRRRIAAKSDPRESSGKYLLRTMFLANVLPTIRSTCNAGNIRLAGLSKPFRYFAIFVAVCLPLVILSYTQFGGLNKAGMLYTQGDYLQQQGRQKDAIAKFDGAIGIDPQLVGAHINRGRAYFSLGQIERAIQDFDESIRLNPERALDYINRGGAYFSLGQNERAIKEFDVGIRLDPQRTTAYLARGNAYFNLGQYQRAIQDYDAGLHLDPRRTKAYLDRGNSYFNLGQYQRAIHDYGIAISFNVRYGLAYRNRAIAFANLGQDGNAKVDLDKACQLDQKYC